MNIQDIKFHQEASRRVYNDYMSRVRKATVTLSRRDQDDIYMEINSHIFEGIQHNNQKPEIDNLLDILQKLGAPEEVLKPLVADKKLEQATRTFHPVHIFKALILNFANGLSYIVFFILYLLLFGFVFLIFAKLTNGPEVGLFFKDGSLLVLGMSSQRHDEGVTELLGNWFIPVMLACIAVFYIVITLLLKLKKSISKK